MSQFYTKINTAYFRDMEKSSSTYNCILPDKGFCQPEFELLKDLKWECTEKIDGCLKSNTRIQMADGGVKLIRDIKEGDIVLGYDTESNNGVLQIPVQKVTKRSAKGTWVKIKATHQCLKKGNSIGYINCTFDHKIWVPNVGYVEAYKLKPGDKILSVRRDLNLTPIQEQILTGKMLGDGSMEKHEGLTNTASIEFGHANHEMVLWTLDGLQELGGNTHNRISGYGSDILCGRTKRSAQIYKLFSHWYDKDNKKQVPNDVKLTPISLAFWYMDDGTLLHVDGQEDRVRFATNGFNKESCENLLKALSAFDIEGTIADYKGNTICLNSENSEKLFLLIFPYICKSYQYKLPERYRDCVPYIPKIKANQYHSELVEQTIISIENDESTHERWDLTTETHNFFTTTGLVHNTNMSVHIIPTYSTKWDKEYLSGVKVEYHGKTEKANIPDHLLKKMQEMFPEDKLIEYFTKDGKEITTPIVLFGEGYGVKIQNGGNYIKDDCSFILFDVKVGNWWLKREDCEQIANDLNIDIVPLVGYFTLKEAEDYVRKGFKSLIAQNRDYDAEGLVCKAPLGLKTRSGERIITKIKTCDFRDLQRKAPDYYRTLYKD